MVFSNPHSQIFILFPESEPNYFYQNKNEGFQPEEFLNEYFKNFSNSSKLHASENYQGYYDSENVKNFIEHYEVLEDFYPTRPSRILHSLLKNWLNWRDAQVCNPKFEVTVLGNKISNDIFCEVLCRKDSESNNHVVVSYDSLKVPLGNLEITNGSKRVLIDCCDLKQLHIWFQNNRMPKRIYHPSPKHGENGKGAFSDASKLLCSHLQAELMLHKAYGTVGKDELFYFDMEHNCYIVFRYEGNIPENQYHAYHLVSDSDVPKAVLEIKRIRDIIDN